MARTSRPYCQSCRAISRGKPDFGGQHLRLHVVVHDHHDALVFGDVRLACTGPERRRASPSCPCSPSATPSRSSSSCRRWSSRQSWTACTSTTVPRYIISCAWSVVMATRAITTEAARSKTRFTLNDHCATFHCPLRLALITSYLALKKSRISFSRSTSAWLFGFIFSMATRSSGVSCGRWRMKCNERPRRLLAVRRTVTPRRHAGQRDSVLDHVEQLAVAQLLRRLRHHVRRRRVQRPAERRSAAVVAMAEGAVVGPVRHRVAEHVE